MIQTNTLTLGTLLDQVQPCSPIYCPQCDKSFKKPSHYTRHIQQRHTSLRQYICQQQSCGKTFKRASHLKRHTISHTHDKPHRCGQCVMAFGYKHHLDRHIKVIHLKELLVCQECTMGFSKKKALYKHRIDEHQPTRIEDTVANTVVETGKRKKRIDKLRSNRRNCMKKDGRVQEILKEYMINNGQMQSEEDNMVKQQIYESKQHEDQDNEELLYRCNEIECISAFARKYQMERHVRQCHQSSSI